MINTYKGFKGFVRRLKCFFLGHTDKFTPEEMEQGVQELLDNIKKTKDKEAFEKFVRKETKKLVKTYIKENRYCPRCGKNNIR